jgi:anti-sigma factor (TIGR02949 family)
MSIFDSLKRMFGVGRREHAHTRCREALRLVHDFIDGELEGVTRAQVEEHFEVCKRCYPHLRLEQRFREALRRACTREKAPPELRDRVLQIATGGDSEH